MRTAIFVALALAACAGSKRKPGPGCSYVRMDVSRWDDACPDAGQEKEVQK